MCVCVCVCLCVCVCVRVCVCVCVCSSVKPVDKRDGSGSRNWGTVKDDLEGRYVLFCFQGFVQKYF